MSLHLSKALPNQLVKQVKSLSNGLQDVPLNVLLNDHFIQRCSFYRNASDFFSDCDFDASSPDSLDTLPRPQVDDFIAQHSDYPSWDEMRNQAIKEYILLHLTKGN